LTEQIASSEQIYVLNHLSLIFLSGKTLTKQKKPILCP